MCNVDVSSLTYVSAFLSIRDDTGDGLRANWCSARPPRVLCCISRHGRCWSLGLIWEQSKAVCTQVISNYRAVKHEDVRRLAASSLSLRPALHVASWKEQLNLDATRRLYPLPAVCIIRLQRCFTLPAPANSLQVLGDNLVFPKKKKGLNVLWLPVYIQSRCRLEEQRSALKLKSCWLLNEPLRYWLSAAYLSE